MQVGDAGYARSIPGLSQTGYTRQVGRESKRYDGIKRVNVKDLVDIFSDLPDERMDESGHDYAHDPLDDLEADCWERFTQDWERED